MTYEDIWNRYCELRRNSCREVKASELALKDAPLNLLDELQQLVSACTFTVRNYGGGQFYCWAHHPHYDLGDPWPASRWPRKSLAMTFVSFLKDQKQEQDAGAGAC